MMAADGSGGSRPLERDVMRLASPRGLTDARVKEIVARVRDPSTPVDLRTVEAVEHLERRAKDAYENDWIAYLDQMPKIHGLLVAVATEYRNRAQSK